MSPLDPSQPSPPVAPAPHSPPGTPGRLPAPAPVQPAAPPRSRTALIVVAVVVAVIACCAISTVAAIMGLRVATDAISEEGLEELIAEATAPVPAEQPAEEGPYPPLLTKRVDAVPPTPDQQLWALATCAILTEYNRGSHSLLGGRIPTPEVEQAQRELLADWWGVGDREDLLDTLAWIEEGGHRMPFDHSAAYLAGLSEAELADLTRRAETDPKLANEIEMVRTYAPRFGERSIVAWDFNRYVALCGWGYAAGYVTEQEAWELIMPAARVLQQTFDSWEELGENHIVGRRYWSFEETQRSGPQMQAAYEHLRTDPASPWNRVPWDLDLGPNEQ